MNQISKVQICQQVTPKTLCIRQFQSRWYKQAMLLMFQYYGLSERPKEYTIVISNVISAIAIDSNTFVVFGFH